jgi:hypothetical protein
MATITRALAAAVGTVKTALMTPNDCRLLLPLLVKLFAISSTIFEHLNKYLIVQNVFLVVVVFAL